MLQRWTILVLGLASACGGTSAADDSAGGGGTTPSGGSGGSKLDGGQWGTGGSVSGGAPGGGGGGVTGGGGAAGAGPSKPYYLHEGRTYDQETDYVAWDGQVSFVKLTHKDQTSLPASEGGASCSTGCEEQVTRIEAGASIWGRFKNITALNVQLASTGEAGVGQGVLAVCGSDLPAFNLTGTSGLPGFNNMPSPAHPVAATDDCEWRVKAVGGFVYFRAVTVTGPGSGGGGGTGGTGAGGTGAGPA